MNAYVGRYLAQILTAKPQLPSLLLALACFSSGTTARAQVDSDGKGSTTAAAHATETADLPTKNIDITPLRKRLATECGLRAGAANDWIRNHVATLLSMAETPSQSSTDGNAAEPKFHIEIEANSAIVTATEPQIAKIQESLERIEETGIEQIVMRLSVYQGPAAAMEQLKIRWAHVETSTSIATTQRNQDGSSEVAQASFSPSQQAGNVTLAGMMLNKMQPTSMEDVLSTRLNKALSSGHAVTESHWIQAQSIVELGTPVLYTMMAPDEIESVAHQAGASQDINAISSTLVAIHNGNPTQINNVIERPFVTAVKPRRVVTDGKSRLLFEPQTKVYPDGFRFIVRPTLVDGSQIRLTCCAEQFGVQKVRTMDIPVAGEVERTIRVQMPTAAKSSVRAQLDIPKNFALALSTESVDKEGKPMTTLFVCQCGSKQLRDPAQDRDPK